MLIKNQMNNITSICYNTDGSKIVSGNDNNSIIIWDINNIKILKKL
jgi:hypothetical protein